MSSAIEIRLRSLLRSVLAEDYLYDTIPNILLRDIEKEVNAYCDHCGGNGPATACASGLLCNTFCPVHGRYESPDGCCPICGEPANRFNR